MGPNVPVPDADTGNAVRARIDADTAGSVTVARIERTALFAGELSDLSGETALCAVGEQRVESALGSVFAPETAELAVFTGAMARLKIDLVGRTVVVGLVAEWRDAFGFDVLSDRALESRSGQSDTAFRGRICSGHWLWIA